MLESFFKDLAANPDDWALRGVMADWHEEHGQQGAADCLRWMAREKKRPYLTSGKQFAWFNADTVPDSLGDPESDVPGPVFRLLKGGKKCANHKTFETLRAAEESFYAAWQAARAAAKGPPRKGKGKKA